MEGYFSAKIPIRFDEWVHYAVAWNDHRKVVSIFENGRLFARPPHVIGVAAIENGFGIQGNSVFIYEIDELYIYEKIKDDTIIALLAGI